MVAGKLDLQKRQHRERAQPLKRQRLGLLEKHADYVKRAKDFHSKEDRIKKLREKAAGRNKDEFYFGMIRSRTTKGVHMQSRGNESLSNDLVKVLKTQDAGYIRTHKAIEQSRVERLQQQLNTFVEDAADPSAAAAAEPDLDDWDAFDAVPSISASSSAAPARKHILFTSDLETVRSADPSSLLSKRPRTSSSTDAPSKKAKKNKAKVPAADPAVLAAEAAEREATSTAYRATLQTELTAREGRLSQLTRALRELEMQRLLMGKGAKKSLVAKKGRKKEEGTGTVEEWQDGEKARRDGVPEADEGIATGSRVWKWKAERKR